MDDFEVKELFKKVYAEENNETIDLTKFMKFMEIEYVQEQEKKEEIVPEP